MASNLVYGIARDGICPNYFFEGTFEDAVAKAKKEKSIFMRFLCGLV
ncbi:MAG: hypothetical protein ACLUDU_03400 [Butyricimonas faecihominis]